MLSGMGLRGLFGQAILPFSFVAYQLAGLEYHHPLGIGFDQVSGVGQLPRTSVRVQHHTLGPIGFAVDSWGGRG